MIARVPLERIFDNPFQTRQDYAGIEELAESIKALKATRPETSGLLQIAAGRLVIPNREGWKVLDPAPYGRVEDALGDEPDAVVHIAFAHRRLRAFHLLNETDPDYQTFPVEILILSDERMSDLAWEENHKRENLSAIEEAEAIQRAMDTFGYGPAEIAERWGLARPSVSNKVRLLKLPTEAKEAIRRGELTERHGRALLTAQGKSPAIFTKALEAILPPPPVAEQAAEIARELLAKRHFYHHSGLASEAVCIACGTPVPKARYTTGNGDQFLCTPCYRVGSYWSPPSVGETEQLIKNITQREATDLGRAKFPLEAEITPLTPPSGQLVFVRSAACTGCTLREEDTCYDKGCYDLKEAAWKEGLVTQLKERLQRDYGVDPTQVTINYSYSGHDLNKHTVDPDLIKPGGPCAPGQCKRLQFHYQDYDSSSDIKVYKDLPFVFQCNHSGAHAAAQRKYQESQKSEDQKTEAVRAAEAVKSHKDLARSILDQATLSLTRALLNHHAGAWRALAEHLGYTSKPADDTEALIHAVATKVFGSQKDQLTGKWVSWDTLERVTRFQKECGDKLGKYGIAQLPQLTDLIARLERMWEFVQGARVAGSLTMEQVNGNRTNLGKLVDQLMELHRAGLLENNPGFSQVNNLVRECLDELWEGAKEIDPELPQDWGMEIEATLGQVVRGVVSPQDLLGRETDNLEAEQEGQEPEPGASFLNTQMMIDPTGKLIEQARKIRDPRGVMEIKGKTYTCTGITRQDDVIVNVRLEEVVPVEEAPAGSLSFFYQDKEWVRIQGKVLILRRPEYRPLVLEK